MTPEERKILEDAENQAFETSQALNTSFSGGIRPEPQVESTESVLDGQSFGLDFGGDSTGQAVTDATPGSFIPPLPDPTGPTGACCTVFGCQILAENQCDFVLGVYQGDGTLCSPDPC
jgi:hypothetical protein